METIKVAAASVRNLFGQPEESIANMQKWIKTAAESGAELILFPELNISGYITAPIAHQLAEPIPGPATEKIIGLAQQIYAYHLIRSNRMDCRSILLLPCVSERRRDYRKTTQDPCSSTRAAILAGRKYH